MSHTEHHPVRTRAAAVTAVAAAAAIATAPAYAEAPIHAQVDDSGSTDYAAGELCDVAVHEHVHFQAITTDFGDRKMEHAVATFTYTNTATGATATDTGRFSFVLGEETVVLTGLGVQLRGPDGEPLGIDAGRTVLDAETFEEISRVGRALDGYEVLVCAALGAEAAG
jgi:hypothetical protein